MRRRGKAAEEYLQCDLNQVQLCPMCHAAETYRMQVYVGLRKLWDLSDFADVADPPKHVEDWAKGIPGKLESRLPSHYWEAADLYRRGMRPGRYKVMGR